LIVRRNDETPSWLDPFAAVIDASAGADGAQNDIGIGLGLIGMFDEEFGGVAQVSAAAFVKTLGARVAIDGVVIREFVVLLDQVGVAPTNEVLFDVGAVGVMADGAFAGVAFESGEIRRFVAMGSGGSVGVAVKGFGDEVGGVSAGDDFGELWRLGLPLGSGLVFACGRVLGDYFEEGARVRKSVGRRLRNRLWFWLRFWFWFWFRFGFRLRLRL
jgi:hypothetical protein